MQWCCQLLQSVAKSRAEFYFVQRLAQQKNCETTHVTLCNSPATCLATALRDKLLRKLHSVTGPLVLGTAFPHTENHIPTTRLVTSLTTRANFVPRMSQIGLVDLAEGKTSC